MSYVGHYKQYLNRMRAHDTNESHKIIGATRQNKTGEQQRNSNSVLLQIKTLRTTAHAQNRISHFGEGLVV